MPSQLVGTDFTAGPQWPNYVNGRLLTAEDMSTGQNTLRARDVRIARAAGSGVVSGLWTTASATTLTIAPGLGIASSGDSVAVSGSVTLPLTFTSTTTAAPVSGSFGCCQPTGTTGSTSIGVGCYLLTARPTTELSGQAPVAAPLDGATSPGCAAQWLVEGVRFTAITLPLGASVAGVAVTEDNRRSLLAHWCFGTEALAELGASLPTFAPAYRGFDSLDPADLTPADVPIAVFYWNGQQVGFVDNWSARRRVTEPDNRSVSWTALTTDRRVADGQARLLQFEDQLADIVAAATSGQTAAADTFGLLPPVGFLPLGAQHVGNWLRRLRSDATDYSADQARIAKEAQAKAAAEQGARGRRRAAVKEQDAAPEPVLGRDRISVLRVFSQFAKKDLDGVEQTLDAQGTQAGFDLDTFFGDAALYGGTLEWELAEFALRQSWVIAPGDVTSVKNSDQPPLRYYFVRQNLEAAGGKIFGSTGAATEAYYVVFIKNLSWFQNTTPPFYSSESFFGLRR